MQIIIGQKEGTSRGRLPPLITRMIISLIRIKINGHPEKLSSTNPSKKSSSWIDDEKDKKNNLQTLKIPLKLLKCQVYSKILNFIFFA